MKEVKDIWQFFENMNEYVYATDIETHEIVYMNRKTLQAYGLQSLEDAKGKKCYEILQKTLIPCGMCNNDRLSVGEFEEWHYYNPIIDRYLMLKDTLIEDSSNGKKYRVELGVDISEKRTQDGVIQKYQNMEFMINEGLRDHDLHHLDWLTGDFPSKALQKLDAGRIVRCAGVVCLGNRRQGIRRREFFFLDDSNEQNGCCKEQCNQKDPL